MTSLKKTNSNKKKVFRKSISKKSLRKTTLKKKVSGGAVPPGIMRQVAKSHLMVKCYKELEEKVGKKCFENMRIAELFKNCAAFSELDEDKGEGKHSIDSIELAAKFNFWTLEGWLNYLNSEGNHVSRRHARGKGGNIKHVILSDGSTIGENKDVQRAIIGSSEENEHNKSLLRIFKMTAEKYAEQINPGNPGDVTLKELVEEKKAPPKSSISKMKRMFVDTEDQCDTSMAPDSFGKGKVDEEIQITDIPLDRQFKDKSGKSCNFKTEEEAIAALRAPRGGKSKRKTYKKTNKKKKK